jgi:hypothetical protein
MGPGFCGARPHPNPSPVGDGRGAFALLGCASGTSATSPSDVPHPHLSGIGEERTEARAGASNYAVLRGEGLPSKRLKPSRSA